MGKQAKAKVKRQGDRAVYKLLERWGVMGRVAELERTFYDPKFRARLNEKWLSLEGTPEAPTDLQGVADIAMALARDEFGVDTTDTMVTMAWERDLGRKLFPEFHPSFEAVQRAQAEVAARAPLVKAKGRRAA